MIDINKLATSYLATAETLAAETPTARDAYIEEKLRTLLEAINITLWNHVKKSTDTYVNFQIEAGFGKEAVTLASEALRLQGYNAVENYPISMNLVISWEKKTGESNE